MKKVFLGVIAMVIFGFSANAQIIKVGTFDGKSTTLDQEGIIKIKEICSKFISDNKMNVEITSFEINSNVDKDANNEKYYFLLGTNKDKTAKMSFLLKLEKGILYSEDTSNTSNMVSCKGCRYGCNPVRVNRVWFCDGGCGTDCSKTVTVRN